MVLCLSVHLLLYSNSCFTIHSPTPACPGTQQKVIYDPLLLTPSKSTCLRHHVPEVKESRGENPNEPFLGSLVTVICGSHLLPLAGILWYCNFANHLYTPKRM